MNIKIDDKQLKQFQKMIGKDSASRRDAEKRNNDVFRTELLGGIRAENNYKQSCSKL